jgi:hypothetical protein
MAVMSFRGRTGRPNGPAVILCVAILLFGAQASGWSDEALAQQVPQGCFLSEKAGFTLMHLEGDPATIGRNHGSMLSEKIERGMAAYAHCSMDWFGLSWAQCRINAPSYWPKVPSEYQQEIQGIASGAASMGVVNPDGATVDWIDILAYNAVWDIWWRVSPPGNKFWWLPGKGEQVMPHHCSGFVSTGSWTADGGFVLAQSLWMPYFLPPAQAVWCDLVPRQGNRIFMQLTAGMIWSGTEYYVNSAGIVAAETTLGVGAHQPGGTASFVRVRKAVQYAGSIDEFRDIMLQDTNGAYCSDYLLADAKTNEAAVLELGGRTWALARTMDGFLPSCNYPWDPAVAAEMGEPQGAAHGCWPRWMRLLDLAAQERGNITVEFGKMALGDHFDVSVGYERPGSFSLCGHGENTTRGYPHGSQDAKVTNRTMAARMQVWARFGHSCGRSFLVEEQQVLHPDYAFDDLRDMIAGPWSTFGAFHQLQISVIDQNGLPIQDVDVRLRDRYDGNQTNITLEDGRILVPYFPAGEYEVWASGNGRRATMLLVVNGSASLDIVLRSNVSSDAMPAMQAVAVAAVALAGAISVVIWKRRRRSA